MQVKQRQDLRDLRRAAHVRGQDRASKPPSLAGGLVHPFVIDPRGLHLDRASPAHDLATLGITVADGQSPPFFVAIGFGHFEVGLYLGLESGSEHLFGSLAGDLVEVEHDLPTSSFVVVYPVPRCTLPADAGTSALPFDCSKGRYTTSLTKSSIHNFRSYLAENSDIDADSVDLVTVASAIHWFDLGRFYAEVRRVARSGGVIAAWTYYKPVFGNNVDAIIQRLAHDILADFWDQRLHYVVDEFHDLPFPFQPIDAPPFRTDMRWNMEDLLGYFETWSSSVKYRQEKRTHPTDLIRDDLAQVWGDPGQKQDVYFPLYMRLGRV